MTKRVFIWVAHPKAGSLCAALADAYQSGVEANGAETIRMDLSEMDFDPHFEGYGADTPALEPALIDWQGAIAWADHVMVIHPYWWGGMPTRAKAVLDRALTPGFGFKYHEKGAAWDKLLKGKTADGIITSDTPPLIDTLLYQKPARRVLKNQVFGFCGMKVRRVVQIGSVKLASKRKIQSWFGRMRRMGERAALS
ncbi:NAD(P)H-dependent oxidoreductase [Henriciella sp.]|uniref:NAD(P)H-dependent oxidoreductase n=1 Tax=Henriciella sp. TaxID=1968823 RepID=UPI00260FE938|nr:NAD(P)H-dependent oxidoreductase [Henriciella sp.]